MHLPQCVDYEVGGKVFNPKQTRLQQRIKLRSSMS